jgi:hypothetical protein
MFSKVICEIYCKCSTNYKMVELSSNNLLKDIRLEQIKFEFVKINKAC